MNREDLGGDADLMETVASLPVEQFSTGGSLHSGAKTLLADSLDVAELSGVVHGLPIFAETKSIEVVLGPDHWAERIGYSTARSPG